MTSTSALVTCEPPAGAPPPAMGLVDIEASENTLALRATKYLISEVQPLQAHATFLAKKHDLSLFIEWLGRQVGPSGKIDR